jgi:hypothetical protein
MAVTMKTIYKKITYSDVRFEVTYSDFIRNHKLNSTLFWTGSRLQFQEGSGTKASRNFVKDQTAITMKYILLSFEI